MTATIEDKRKAIMRRELAIAANTIIRHATAGDWYPQPWVCACVLQRARELGAFEYTAALAGILGHIARRRETRN